MKTLPSAHQHGDAVNLHFGDAGIIQNAKITKVSFDPGKIFYDAEIKVKPGMTTRLRMIDSNFVEKIVHTYTIKSHLSDFSINKTYSLYDSDVLFTWKKNVLQNNAPGTDDPNCYPVVKYKGYNMIHDFSIFESTFLLNENENYQIPVERILPNNEKSNLVYRVTFEKAKGPVIPQPDEIPLPIKAERTIYEIENTPIFSIKDIDKIFDYERRNHGTTPLDSINRMYRKLLSLKEKGE